MDRHRNADEEKVDGGGSGEPVLTEREIEAALEVGGEERDEEGDRNRRRERRQQACPGTDPHERASCREHRPEPGGRQGERDEMMLPERRPRERAREQQQPRRGDAPPPIVAAPSASPERCRDPGEAETHARGVNQRRRQSQQQRAGRATSDFRSSAATIPGRQGSPSRPNTASMSAGGRAIWNASSAVTPRWGGIEQPVAGTTRETSCRATWSRARRAAAAPRGNGARTAPASRTPIGFEAGPPAGSLRESAGPCPCGRGGPQRPRQPGNDS